MGVVQKKNTHRIQTFFLELGFLQVVTPLGHAEEPPALTDFLIDLGLWEVGQLLLHFQVDVIVVEKVSRPAEATPALTSTSTRCNVRVLVKGRESKAKPLNSQHCL